MGREGKCRYLMTWAGERAELAQLGGKLPNLATLVWACVECGLQEVTASCPWCLQLNNTFMTSTQFQYCEIKSFRITWTSWLQIILLKISLMSQVKTDSEHPAAIN